MELLQPRSSAGSGSATLVVRRSTFAEVSTIWQRELWPNRQSPIEPISCIQYDGKIDPKIQKLMQKNAPAFWVLCDQTHHIQGVVSCHPSTKNRLRLRGIWVHPSLRGQGFGEVLFQKVLEYAIQQNIKQIWTMARANRIGFYNQLGFQTGSEINGYEFGPHILASYDLAPSNGFKRLFSSLFHA